MKPVTAKRATELSALMILVLWCAALGAQSTPSSQQASPGSQQPTPAREPVTSSDGQSRPDAGQTISTGLPSVALSPQEPPSNSTPEEAADFYFAQGRYQAAIAAYKKVDPATASAWNKMGMSYQKMYQLDEAKKCYESSLKLNSKNVNYLNNLATVYSGMKLYGMAERTYRKALKIDANNALIYKNLGTMYMTSGKFAKGKKCYDEARKLDPDIFTSRAAMSVSEPTDVRNRGAMNYFMARSCMQSGQTECAITYLRAALNEGYTTAKKLATDPDFERLRNVYAFQQMLAEQSTKAAAPATNKDAH